MSMIEIHCAPGSIRIRQSDSFKIKNRKIYYKNQLVEDLNNSWSTTSELMEYAGRFDIIDFENYLAEHKNADSNHIISDFIEHQGCNYCPNVLRKWLKSYGVAQTLASWHRFEMDVVTNQYPCTFVDADVAEMDDDEVMSFVRKHRQNNIPIWHELRKQLYCIDSGQNGYREGDKQSNRQQAYRYAAGKIANMEDEDIWDMLENC